MLSVCVPHGGHDEEDYIVKMIMEEGKGMGAEEFFVFVVTSTLMGEL